MLGFDNFINKKDQKEKKKEKRRRRLSHNSRKS